LSFLAHEFKYSCQSEPDLEFRSDEDIVMEAKNGDIIALEFLINKYKNFVKAKARSYFLIGADREDIIQEGMIGLYKAIRDFRGDKLSSFPRFCRTLYHPPDHNGDQNSNPSEAYPTEFLRFFK
jgi:DNA-directed RNA polymerase sigma subunit (sigma70/sigma32)